jgi:diacylglycerol kinase
MENKTSNKSEKQIFSIVKRGESFRHALNGIRIFLKTTHNAWIHGFFAIFAIYFGFYFHISTTEWLFVTLTIGLVFTSEAFNTAMEFDMDLTSPEYHPYARYTKDIAAGAVLISCIIAIVIGLIIFIPKFARCF